MTAALASIPILAPSTRTSASNVSSCSVTKLAGTLWIPVTPVVVWATSAVTTAMPYPPKAENALRSAWIPAPPLGSVPAMDSKLEIKAVSAVCRA